MSEDEQMGFWEWYADELDQLERAFPRILRYSVFVFSYSFFEKALLQIASHCQHTHNLRVSPFDLQDKGIRRAQTYLKKVALVQFPDTEEACQDISALNVIRNQIVHNDGKIQNINKKIENFIEKWNIDISLSGIQLELSPHFIIRVLDTFETFFDELLGPFKLQWTVCCPKLSDTPGSTK